MSGEVPQAAAPAAGVNRRLVVFTAGLVALSLAEYWLLFTWEGVALRDKLAVVLTIIGAYGTALGLLRRSQALKAEVRDLIGELASPNAALCWGANLVMLSIPLNLLSIVLSGRKRIRQPVVLALLGTLASIAAGLVLVVYVFFHALVVVPISYPALLVAAAVVSAFDAAADDMAFGSTDASGKASQGASLKQTILEDKAASTAFIMGLPAGVIALVGKVFTPFFS